MTRLTLRGSVAFERRLAQVVDQIADHVVACAGPSHVKGLLLIGGYGRGEGGVETVDGVERAHNNLDFLLFTRHLGSAARRALRARIEDRLERARLPVPADVGVLDEHALDHADGKVMWFDVRGGHRVVRGHAPDALRRFTLATVPASDVRALLVNRATLLLLSEELLAQLGPRPDVVRATVKHSVKAILGYGDAFLYAHGRYHWSYVEKQRRMRATSAAPGMLRELYDQAAEFRFAPDYATWEPSEPLRVFPCKLSELWVGIRGVNLPRRIQKNPDVLKSPDSGHLRTCHIEPFLPWVDDLSVAFHGMCAAVPVLNRACEAVQTFGTSRPVIGVNVRSAQKDPRTVGVEWFIETIAKLPKSLAIFLATDDHTVTEAFASAFGDRVYQFQRKAPPGSTWYKYDRDSIIKQAAELYILAECDWVIGSNHSSMSQTVAFMRGATYTGPHEKPGGLGNLWAARYCDAWNEQEIDLERLGVGKTEGDAPVAGDAAGEPAGGEGGRLAPPEDDGGFEEPPSA